MRVSRCSGFLLVPYATVVLVGRWAPHRSLGDVAAAPHIVALSHPSLVASEVVQHLQHDHGIVCSSRAGALRVSLAPYNDETDVVALLDALGTM